MTKGTGWPPIIAPGIDTEKAVIARPAARLSTTRK
jgi:hypothetical protein